MTRSLKKFDSDAFNEVLDKVPFSAAYVFEDIGNIYWMWETLFTQALNEHAPIRFFKKWPDQCKPGSLLMC